MLWSSLVVAILIVSLVLVAFALLRLAVEARQVGLAREEALTRKEMEAEGLSTALAHFRHNLQNLLDGVGHARQLAMFSLDQEQPEHAAEALELIAEAVATSTHFVNGFRPGEGVEERPTVLDIGVLASGLGRLLGDETHQVLVSDELRGWLVEEPPVAMAVLLGNLLKNAVESASEVRLVRRADSVAVENPVSAAELERLRSSSIFERGTSSKGEGRGIGLHSARHLADTCGVALDHETFRRDGRDWVRFAVSFPDRSMETPVR